MIVVPQRLAEADAVVFDKTGTLTTGTMRVTDHAVAADDLAAASSIASFSRHPASRAIAALTTVRCKVEGLREQAGSGIEGRVGGKCYRLGRREWASPGTAASDAASTWLSRDGRPAGSFAISDRLRPGAVEAVARLTGMGMSAEVLSGDTAEAVGQVASSLRISQTRHGALPQAKVERLAELASAGRRVLMVGDGLNDAPALAAAHVSIAPSSAADVGRNAADMVFLGSSLEAVPQAIEIARSAACLVHQNLGLAIVYNVLVVPLAVLGYVTPLMAAIAMSTSSIVVVANALRLPDHGKAPASVPDRNSMRLAEVT